METIEESFKYICGSDFWQSDLISAHVPDFTVCFQQSILLWLPCFSVWFTAPCWIYMLTKKKPYRLQSYWLLVLKFLTIFCLIGIEVHNLHVAIRDGNYLVYVMTPLVLMVTYLTLLFITFYEHHSGYRSSMLAFTFWILLTSFSLFILRSQTMKYFKKQPIDMIAFYKLSAFIGLSAFSLVVSTISYKIRPSDEDEIYLSPFAKASLLSRLTYWWMNPIIYIGYLRDLVRGDLWQLDHNERCEYQTKKVESELNKLYERQRRRNREKKRNSTAKAAMILNMEEGVRLSSSDSNSISDSSSNGSNEKLPLISFVFCLCKVFGPKLLAAAFLKLIQDLLNFANPLLLSLLIKFIIEKNQPISIGIFYASLLLVVSTVKAIVLTHYFHRMYTIGARIKTSMVNIVYKKSLRLSPTARRSTTIGEMSNLVTINAQVFSDLMPYLNMIWSSPLQISLSIIFLWRYLGVASLAGLATLVLIIPLNVIISHSNRMVKLSRMKFMDSRIKMISELLNGIKVIKFYGWELSFKKIIDKIRSDEMKHFRRSQMLSLVSDFTWEAAPFLVAAVSFSTFVLIDEKNVLDSYTAFISLSLFDLLRFPLIILPMVVSGFINAYIAVQKINDFLSKEEILKEEIETDSSMDIGSIKVENVTLGWNFESETLKHLNFEVEKGKLVAIIGKVGAGKSSLMSGLLGEMHKLNPNSRIVVNGSTAYASQQAWIKNASLKENILFGNPFDPVLYNTVINAASLKDDIEIMPAGDETEIGEKGINLSGGQKQRVSLARAIYSGADIYLFDDPLSAVDAHVGQHIFNYVIGSKGLLKDKTRLFVTNSLNFLSQCDKIMLIEDGCIIQMGTYAELRKASDGRFNHFISSIIESGGETADQPPPEEKICVKKCVLKESNSFNNKFEINPVTFSVVEKSPARRYKESIHPQAQLVKTEKVETGSVKSTLLSQYIKSCNVENFILFILFIIISKGFYILANIWLSKWAASADEELLVEFYLLNRNSTVGTSAADLNNINNNNSSSSQSLYERNNFRLFVYIALGFCQLGAAFLAQSISIRMTNLSVKRVHDSLLYAVLRSKMQFFESTPSGRVINRMSKDLDALHSKIPTATKEFLFCLASLLALDILVSVSTPLFLITLAPIFLLYFFIQRYYVASTRQLRRIESASSSPIYTHYSESLAGADTIRAFKAQKRFIRQMQFFLDENLTSFHMNQAANRWSSLRLEVTGNLMIFLAAFFAVLARDTSNGGLAISLSLSVSAILSWFVRTTTEFEANITSLESIQDYIQNEPEDEWTKENRAPPPEWPSRGKIVFRNLSVKYRDELDLVLSDLSFTIRPGEKIGICGRTGAGKSTLILALFRMLEFSYGDIIIDGVDIKTIGLHDLRQKLTIIPQDPIVFSGTIRMNLDPLRLYDETELWNALDSVNFKDYVWNLKERLETVIVEGGENLSVGQRQLICLARALLRRTKILVLDEATASVDQNTDELIQQTIRKSFADCTVLTIAHRINTIIDYTRIMVLDGGRIVEFDTPENLLANPTGYFFQLYKPNAKQLKQYFSNSKFNNNNNNNNKNNGYDESLLKPPSNSSIYNNSNGNGNGNNKKSPPLRYYYETSL